MPQEEHREQFLFFTIRGIPLAVPFSKLKEGISLTQSILSVPGAPEPVRGVINYRGSILAILDLSRFISQSAKNLYKHILVIQNRNTEAGILIDEVPQIASVDLSKIQNVSSFKTEGLLKFVEQEIERDNIYYGVLDAGKILKK